MCVCVREIVYRFNADLADEIFDSVRAKMHTPIYMIHVEKQINDKSCSLR